MPRTLLKLGMPPLLDVAVRGRVLHGKDIASRMLRSKVEHSRQEIRVNVPVRIEPAAGAPVAVEYRWDPDTDILTANLCANSVGEGLSGSVGVEGTDGSWLILDVSSGRINGVEVAVWPDVHRRASLDPPTDIENVRVTVPARTSQPGIAAVEMDTSLTAEADKSETTIHFRLGNLRQTRTVRIAQDILLDIDQRERIAGLWLLNVPPFPLDS